MADTWAAPSPRPALPPLSTGRPEPPPCRSPPPSLISASCARPWGLCKGRSSARNTFPSLRGLPPPCSEGTSSGSLPGGPTPRGRRQPPRCPTPSCLNDSYETTVSLPLWLDSAPAQGPCRPPCAWPRPPRRCRCREGSASRCPPCRACGAGHCRGQHRGQRGLRRPPWLRVPERLPWPKALGPATAPPASLPDSPGISPAGIRPPLTGPAHGGASVSVWGSDGWTTRESSF